MRRNFISNYLSEFTNQPILSNGKTRINALPTITDSLIGPNDENHN